MFDYRTIKRGPGRAGTLLFVTILCFQLLQKSPGLLQVKEVKEKELMDLQNRIQEFQQSADDKMGKKRQELFKPILDKAQKAIKDVGSEGGYDYIFDGGQLLYAKDSENIVPAVKAKLGIK